MESIGRLVGGECFEIENVATNQGSGIPPECNS